MVDHKNGIVIQYRDVSSLESDSSKKPTVPLAVRVSDKLVM